MARPFTPIHPLAMARAMEEINDRCGAVIMEAINARDLAEGANEAQLRVLLGRVCDAADRLRASLWNDEP